MKRVLVACEFSGTVRDAFTAAGHWAISCDILPSETPGKHWQGDVAELLDMFSFDLIIAHPPCTYLCNSGVRWLYEREGRWDQMRAAVKFFNLFWDHAPMVAVENPIPHKHGLGNTYDQIVQPWHFGDLESKAVCLWLKSLPPLQHNKRLKPEGVIARVHKKGPGPNRSKERSRFFPGIAAAMAKQWGVLLTG